MASISELKKRTYTYHLLTLLFCCALFYYCSNRVKMCCLTNKIIFTARNEVWGKVICLHLSVILSTGGELGPGGVCLVPGVCAWSRGVGCLVQGGCLVWGGGGAWSWGGGVWWRPPWTATAAGGTHPTGMHSCSIFMSISLAIIVGIFFSK